jgi:dTDP-4-dehydrorhamnose reductase
MAARVFITGSTGKLGRQLVNVFPYALAPTRKELDITDKDAVLEYTKANRPKTIVHCAALTGIRECEEDKETAWRVNVEGTENLVKACETVADDCYFVYVSTACIFYGDKGNYVETDIPHPKNFYSLTKLLGEFVVKYSTLKKWLIIRTNFVAREKWPYAKAFVDRCGTYLFADDLARGIKTVTDSNITGILHICGEEKLSMYELAKITTPDVKSMSQSEYKGPPLTMDMSLNSIRLKPFKITRKSTDIKSV